MRKIGKESMIDSCPNWLRKDAVNKKKYLKMIVVQFSCKDAIFLNYMGGALTDSFHSLWFLCIEAHIHLHIKHCLIYASLHTEQLQKLRIRRNILKKTSKKMRFQLFESLLEFQGIYLKLFFFWHVWLYLLLAL